MKHEASFRERTYLACAKQKKNFLNDQKSLKT